LWYLIWQWIQPTHTLSRVVSDARRGGADRLCSPHRRLSQRIQSRATTAYAKARQRLPLAWVQQAFSQLAASLLRLRAEPTEHLPVRLLDGSTKRLRPYGDIPQQFRPHRTRRKKSYWCLARVVGCFCATTGIVTAARIASTALGEQTLAVEMILQAAQRVLYIGDRNFGIWRVVRAAVQGGGHVLVRLTKVRARCLLGRKRWPAFLDEARTWSPSRHDQLDTGLTKEPVGGRLLILQTSRPGFRPVTLLLFTTLTDCQAYPPPRLLELYGWRWQVELNFRHLKSTMGMDQSEAKSAAMVCKEFYGGLMAYNLVRGLMALAAQQADCRPAELSFATVQGLLVALLMDLLLGCVSNSASKRRLEWFLTEAAAAKLPRRQKPRPSEPRAQHHIPQVFPRLRTSREEARLKLKKLNLKC
jgi:hypothetical protein